MGKPIALSAEEVKLLSTLSVESLRILVELKESGRLFTVLSALVNQVIDTEKNYIFGLPEDEKLLYLHAFSRGKAAFGITFVKLIVGAGSELARREKIQQEIKRKQVSGNGNE